MKYSEFLELDKSIIEERILKLEKDLKINNNDATKLNKFLSMTNCYKNYSPNYQYIKEYCISQKEDFNDILRLYNLWLDQQAEELKKPKLKGLLIHQNKRSKKTYINVVDFIGDLIHYYKLLKCDKIYIIERKIKNKIYDFIIDDNYLLKANDYKNITAIQKDNKDLIMSNFLIVGQADKDGKETSLTISDINQIKQSCQYIKIEDIKNLVVIYDF